MEILLIGNGFDLAHGLPTKYRDFLDFCQGIEILYSEPFASLKDYDAKLDETLRTDVSFKVLDICSQAYVASSDVKYVEHVFWDDDEQRSSQLRNAIQGLYQLIHNNIWIQYFNKQASHIGENWIDFEAEISAVVQSLDAAYHISSDSSTLATKIWRISTWSFRDAFHSTVTDSFINFLNEELAQLIRALEIYISGFINDSTIKQKNPDIDQLHPDHVLSFNYSNTYDRIYGIIPSMEQLVFENLDRIPFSLRHSDTFDRIINWKPVIYDYIHGKAELGNNKDNCNLVLGIDEYLDDDRKNTDLRFLTFKKFYQRIYKSTDSQYLKWIDEIKRNDEPSTLYVFGHSLDITDRDVLQALICCPHMQTKIFYHRKSPDDKQALGKLIHNLLLLLGQEELIRRTSGANRTIEFIPQTL